MNQILLNEERESSVQGLNCQGKISIKGDNLRLDITQFQRGKFYFVELNSSTMQKEISNPGIFSKTIDIFNELIENKLLEITDEGCLIMPMQVSLKNKLINLKNSIPLKHVQFNSEEQQKRKFYNEINRILYQKASCQKIISFIKYPNDAIHFNFIGDTTNAHYKSFEVTKNGKQIKMLESNILKNFNHILALPNKEKYYYSLKIVKSSFNKHYSHQNLFYLSPFYKQCSTKYISVGICDKEIIGEANFQTNPYYIGLDICEGKLFSNKTSKRAVKQIPFQKDKSVFKMQINMNSNILTWYLDDKQLDQQRINKDLLKKEICPVVSLYTQGDTIEFID